MKATQRDCRKTSCLKNPQKNLPQQARKSPKCCAEGEKTGVFQWFLPTFQKLFLKSDFFDSLNGLRYPRWGGRRNAVRLEKG